MKLPRRRFLQFATGLAALPVLSRAARAQSFPNKPVHIVSGFPPGGINDTYARLIGQWLSERFGQSFVVENRAGAGGNLASESVVRAAPDGYTLLLATSADAWNTTLYENLKFTFFRDVAPVASLARGIGVLVVHPSFPARSVPELIAYVKDNPGKITVASAGVGSAPHVYWEMFRTLAGVDMLHVPYRGGGPALTDMLGGQVQVYFATMTASIEYIRTGRLRPLATTGALRSAVLPDIPALAEFLPGYEASIFVRIVAPRNTRPEIVDKLNQEINLGLADARMARRIAELGDAVLALSPPDFGGLIAEETEKWARVIRAAHIKAE
jgi:tripartite-type tricarboxylate transporter receptor subunit TctC